jgi:hypothetical protein
VILIYAVDKYQRKKDGVPTGEFGFSCYYLEESEGEQPGQKQVLGFKQGLSGEVASQLAQVPGYYRVRKGLRSIDQKRVEIIVGVDLVKGADLFSE